MADQLERTKPSEKRREFDEAVEDGKDPEAIAKEQEGAEESKAPTQETTVPEVVDDDDDEEDDGEEGDEEADVEDEGEEEGDEEDEGEEEADGSQKEWTTAEKAEIYVMNALGLTYDLVEGLTIEKLCRLLTGYPKAGRIPK